MIALLTLDVHKSWAWFVILGNALAGIWSLGAHKWPQLRSRALWWYIVVVEVAVFVQVILGVLLVARSKLVAPQFHMFYGFVAIIAVTILYGYRNDKWAKDRVYLLYGFGSLFLMGLGIRAMLVAGPAA